MENSAYRAVITVKASPAEVMKRIARMDIWWTDQFAGKASAVGDEFTIGCPDGHWSKHKLIEVVPGKRLVWLTTESRLAWVEGDKFEWNDTRMVFEITSRGAETEVAFTHEGLTPVLECYEECEKGWDVFIKKGLYEYLSGSL